MVFQLFALYPHMNVRQNIGYPLRYIGMPKALIESKVEEAARILRIEHLLDKPVSGLSGGDRQRVALGRAIVREPKAFMMDEPLGALDAEFRHVMCGELRALHNRLKATTVYVTHDQLEAMSMADTIAVMNHGVIEQLALAAGDLRPAGFDVRRRLHRLAADEFHPLPRALPAGATTVTIAGAQIALPAAARGSAPRATWCWACGPSMCVFGDRVARSEARSTAPSISARRRSSRSRRDEATLKARLPAHIAVKPARSSASPSSRKSCRCSTPRADAPSAPRCTRRLRHG